MALTSAVVSGAAWTIATGIGSRLLSLAGTLTLTYFLTLDIQGEVSNAYILVVTAHWATCGMTPYLTAKPDSDHDLTWNIAVAHMGVGVVAAALAVVVAFFAGPLLKAPGMATYAPGFAIALLLIRFSQVPERIVTRNLDFRTIGLARGSSETAYAAFAVLFAAFGFGGMSIVYGNVARGLVSLAILIPRSEPGEWMRVRPVRWSALRPVVRFALPLSGSGLVTTLTRRWDNLFLSNRFGAAVAGAYNSAYGLADVPALQVGEQIGDVLLPSFARMKTEERREAVVHATGLLALVVFPLAIGLGAVADSVVRTLLHPSYWELVSPMLSILACTSVSRPIAVTIVTPYLEASGRTRPIFALAIAELVLLFACLFLLGRPSWRWACYAVALAFVLHAIVSLWLLELFDGIRMTAFLREIGPVLGACVPMAAAVLAVRWLFVGNGLEAYALRLALEVMAGAVSYVFGALFIARRSSRELLRFAREAKARRRARA